MLSQSQPVVWGCPAAVSGHIEPLLSIVMAGLVPAIYAFLAAAQQDVDARDKRGHDAEKAKNGRVAMLQAQAGADGRCVGLPLSFFGPSFLPLSCWPLRRRPA
jgi:hypothetical protein